jgi:hypothetical protein
MERFLIVDSKRPWVDREDIKPGDQVVAYNEFTHIDHKVEHTEKGWTVEGHESVAQYCKEFKDLFVYFRNGWKFYKIVRNEPFLCANCGALSVHKEGDMCMACAHP